MVPPLLLNYALMSCAGILDTSENDHKYASYVLLSINLTIFLAANISTTEYSVLRTCHRTATAPSQTPEQRQRSLSSKQALRRALTGEVEW